MIEVEQLSKLYGSSPAIQDVTFTVQPGEILGFLGPNGAGKTTTMRILTGYLPATSGTARVAGFDVHSNSMAVRQRIGYLPETPPLYPEMTVAGFLTFVARIKGVSAGDRPQQVHRAMERCNLLEKETTLIRKLSKGFRQRVGIAQAIVHDPPVIILDEPTVGLDPRQIIDVRNLIKSLAGEHTIILSTHILPEVKMTCDRIAIINQGKVVATNQPDELVNQLQGGVQYELDLAGDKETAVRQLRNMGSVETIEVLAPPTAAETDRDETRIRINVRLQPQSDAGPAIAKAIIAAGLDLYEMRRTQASLEDVFLNLTTADQPFTDTEAASISDNRAIGTQTPLTQAAVTQADATQIEATQADATQAEATQANTMQAEDNQPAPDASAAEEV